MLRPLAHRARMLHRRLAWAAGAAAILWALTGFLHPLMMWTAPRPAVQTPPYNEARLEGLAVPGAMLSAAGVREADLVRLVGVNADRLWLARADRRIVAVNAVSGAAAQGVLARHAEKLARYYAGGATASVASIREVRGFSTEYPSVNRLLPVWRVEFDTPGRLAVYVDPMTDRLAAVTDMRRRILLSVFQNVHKLSFLSAVEPVRRLAILALVGSTLAMSLAGFVLLMRPGAVQGVRRVHRLIGWAAAPVVIMFTVTGLFHLFAGRPPPPAPATAFNVASLMRLPDAPAAERIVAGAGPSGPTWRVSTAERAAYFDGGGAPLTLDDAARARVIAGAAGDATVSTVTAYTNEYGFAMKRLPVLRVETPGAAIFVDVEESLIAGVAAGRVARVEAWSFDNLHKFGLLNALGKRNRDYVSMLCAALVVGIAAIGAALAWRRRTFEKHTVPRGRRPGPDPIHGNGPA